MHGKPPRRLRLRASIVVAIVGLSIWVPATSYAASSCGTSNGVTICLNAPDGVLSGDVLISAATSGSLSGVTAVIFYWGSSSSTGTHLLEDFSAPFQFTWRTDQYVDATQFLVARVQKNTSTLGSPISMQLTISNGNVGSVPQNPSNWASLFQPRAFVGDPVIAAVGDGGDGTTMSDQTAASVLGSEASIALFLGDLYEKGTAAEWDNNFGRAAFDPRGGASRWGLLASFTKPTLGNHEAQNLSTWRNYWHGRPNWETFVFGGVRFIDLNSECSQFPCGTTSPQYQFVQNTLAANTFPCTVAFWHRPVLSAVDDSTSMVPLWALLANNGVDLVLNGHTHTMERYLPMNAALKTGQPDSHMVEVVSGAGGHNETATADTDPRHAWQVRQVSGAMYLTPVGGASGQATRLDWEFRNNSGSVLSGSSSSVDCGGTTDVTPPSTPGQPSGQSDAPGAIALTWPASTDDIASTLSYSIYRDGDPTRIATVSSASTTSVTYTDTGLAPASVHTYAVTASDGPNTSPLSDASEPIMVREASPLIFADGFDTGFGNWTSMVGLSVDSGSGSPAAPSALAQLVSRTGYASKSFANTSSSICASEQVFLTSVGTSGSSLFRLRTSADGPIIRVSLMSNRSLWMRSDVSGVQVSSSSVLPIGSWNTVELCGTVGSSGAWSLYLNGAQVAGPWLANTGTVPAGRIVIGTTDARTVTAGFDDVRVDQSPGNT